MKSVLLILLLVLVLLTTASTVEASVIPISGVTATTTMGASNGTVIS